MNFYHAKFERESKDNPMDYIIIPTNSGFDVQYIGKPQTTCPDGDHCSEPNICKLMGRCNTGQSLS